MSWFCCGREQPLKKKNIGHVYQKQRPIEVESAVALFPTKLTQVGSAQGSSSERKEKKGKLFGSKPVYVQKENDFTAIEEQQKNEKFVLKKIRTCGYDAGEMEKRYKGTSDKWTDPDFSYDDIVVGQTKAKWKRPEEFISKPDLFPEEVSPNDIIQGKLNDCYFLSAVSALAEKPYRIYSLFSTNEYNPNGYYVCKLNFNGIYQQVIVDDLFPVIESKPIYSQPAQGRFIWAMVLQKCWAKLLQGYKNCNYGYTNEAFQTLTGAPTKAYILGQYKPIDPSFESLFKILKQSDQKNYAIQVCRNRAGSYKQQRDSVLQEGLPMGHAYSLVLMFQWKLGVYETTLKTGEKVRFMQIRNPWGTQESQLVWNDKDPRWADVYPAEKQRMQFRYNKGENDGVFYMDWRDYVEKFDHLFSICEIHDNANYVYYDLTAKDRLPIYLQVMTDGSPEDVGIYFVQEMQEHFKEQYRYCGISVVASRQTIDKHNQKQYEYLGAFNYFNSVVDNFFTLPVRKAPKGKYLLRVYVYWPQPCEKQAQIVVGLYSGAVVGIRELGANVVDDQQYIEKNCISRSLKSQNKQVLQDDPDSWICKQILSNTNIGFVVFHYGNKSPMSNYVLKFDESQNKSLYFLGDYRGKSKFDLDCDKGYDYVIINAFVPEYDMAMDKNLYPTYDPKFRLPNPEIMGVK